MVALLAFGLLAGHALGQNAFPSKPITMVVGFEPGGGTDGVARVVAKFLGDNLGQQVLVENRAGAGGDIAVDYVAHAAPDGYTIVLANVGSVAVNPHLLKLHYDPFADLSPISMATIFPNVIVVHPNVPAKTLAEFVKLARENPGKITFGSSGVGGAGHLAGELLAIMANVKLVHVPYKGGGPAMRGLLGGEIDAYFATPIASITQIHAGRARALAVTSLQRSKLMPDVPTVAESGYPGYEALNWYAYFAPGKTPREVIERLNREIVKVLRMPQAIALLEKQGVDPAPDTPEALAAYLKREYDRWGKLVKERNIKPE
ncbi:MAG: tripartite tricarboxylate transporter substrate binding protein [Betaproteobacteria bacterium]|nr:tripartite tricarboxylate transporter substrate binding protein [Betaproteobacteria bacterium]